MMMRTHAFEYPPHHRTPWHQHESGQLYWLKHGVIVIETACAQWTVTPGSLGWFPAGLPHRAWAPGALQGSSLYFTPSAAAHFPAQPGIYGAERFVQALLQRAEQLSQADFAADYSQHLLMLIGYELARSAEIPLHLPLPGDRRARNVADELLNNPATVQPQQQLAQRWGLSVRTLSRLFRQQTGLSFSQWRQQAKIVVSLQWLLAGETVSEAAARSGYGNVSAYIDAFRQRFGQTPGQFQAARRA